ncbi:MAG TPA: hypothetical protein VH274_03360 [Mycobacteriales bacterium]|nr:hypothetical protein [Mycobacteriales bacterium]
MTVAAAGWWARHGVHTTLVLIPALLIGLIGLGADLRSWWRRTGRSGPQAPTVMLVAAVLSLAAALIHVAVCPEHFREGTVYGLFFAVSAGCQLGWSALVLARPAGWNATTGLLGNAAIVMLWAVTRTVGIPLGPAAGDVERVGVLDLLCAGCEIGVVTLCVVAIRQHVHPWRTQRRSGYATPSSTV